MLLKITQVTFRKKGKLLLKVISFDIDMTLFDFETQQICSSALETIESLRKKSKIVLATGRNMTLDSNQYIIDLLKPDAIIHMNGTKVEINGEILYEEFIKPELLEAMINRAEKMSWCIGTSQNSIMYTTNKQKIIEIDTNRLGYCNRNFSTFRNLMATNVHSFIAYEKSETLGIMAAEFPMLRFAKFTPDFGADVIPLNLSKATGMNFLLSTWNYKFKDVISVGDSMNDYEILKKSGIGIAMGNADDDIKKIADIVTDNINEDGIYKAFKTLDMI